MMSADLEGLIDPKSPYRRKRATAVKSTRPKNMFIPGTVEDRWSKFEHWLRCVLQLYVSYAEVVKPKLNDDGTVKLDSFGRTAAVDTAEQRGLQHKVKKGAVWFTLETLREGWAMALNQVAYRFEPATAAVFERRAIKQSANLPLEHDHATARVRVSNAHPMDKLVATMVKDGRLIRPRGNQYMLSKDMCDRLEMPEAWAIHLDRGARWEGLFYTSQQVPWDKVKVRHKAVLDDRAGTHATIWRPNATLKGKRHPNEVLWDSVYSAMAPYLMFDRMALATVAMAEAGLDCTDPSDPRIDQHIRRWHSTGKIIKVLPRLYRSKEFDAFERSRENFERPLRRPTGDWMIEWLLYWAPIQAKDDRAFFTAKMIRDYYETEADEAWVAEHLPNGLPKPTVTSRLSYFKLHGALETADLFHHYRISPDSMLLLAPSFERIDPLHYESALALTEMDIIDAGFPAALEMITPASPGRHIARVFEKITQMPVELRKAHLFELSRKVKQTPSKLIELFKHEQIAWS